ncbi:hypothetical protein [Pleionea sediminis]|uniref:hypothetical protein n=1 Tax=Pleionea sediminis TaxID=2569479 RepID=UPI00118629C4|nr:hypothetical protein [Pleionea sediminis]
MKLLIHRWLVLLVSMTLSGCMTLSPVDGEQKILFIGSLKSLTLKPVAEKKRVDSNTIVLSNRCSRQLVELEVIEVLRAKGATDKVTLDYYTGEWCRSDFAVSREPILVLVHFNSLFGLQVTTSRIYHDSSGREVVFIEDWWLPKIGSALRLFKPTDIKVVYRTINGISPKNLNDLLAKDFLRKDGGDIVYSQGVYLDDLREMYSKQFIKKIE